MNFKPLLIFTLVLMVNGADDKSVDYMDSVISMLMTGDSVDYDEDNNNEAETEPTLIGGVWQCGSCALIGDHSLIYSEHNTAESYLDDLPIEIQIGIAAPNMRCVTLTTDLSSSVVRTVAGACSSGVVTLSVSPPQKFIVRAYS
ncbi:uncharacterized protein LOC128676497 [Plodia interpunctella]|uniref:uncharacterized protein LOC128676497 n=1 Tax=Plodia interpunctella TaxID=58824 RepID=UPI0023674DBF|nr:uncharacterized protein LOC128676497 [Plodia interpunctella]